MLARLARWLRLLGADVVSGERLHGGELVRLARAEDRIALTRDKRLRTAPEVLFIESNFFREQLIQVMRERPFDPRARIFTRCIECNQPLRTIGRELVARRV